MGLTEIFSSIFPTAYAEEEQPVEVVEVVEEVVEEAAEEPEEEEEEELEDPKEQIMEGKASIYFYLTQLIFFIYFLCSLF